MTTAAVETTTVATPVRDPAHRRLWTESERRRLVRLCASITRDRDAAEDLAQEALLEAWRNRHKLHDPSGAGPWVDAVARNVCLRWARRQGRQLALVAPGDDGAAVPADFDVEVELERSELAELLDRALALLPPDTREVLVQRYVHDSPHAEIGARLGLSEDAVSMRLSRGKVGLRRLLASDLARDAAAYGLVEADATWRETRIWCADCGRRRLLARREEAGGAISFRCADCNSNAPSARFPLANPTIGAVVGELVRPARIHARGAAWVAQYFRAGAADGGAPCTRGGRPARVQRYFRERDGKRRDGLYVDCGACGEQLSASARGIADGVDEVRAFRRRHTRTRAVPDRHLEYAAVPAVAVGYEDMLGSSGVTVFFARDTLRVLDARTD